MKHAGEDTAVKEEAYPSYYGKVRSEILPLMPARAERLLDFGCGEGATAGFLKEQGYCDWASGVELFPEAARIARGRLDELVEGDLETMEFPFEAGSFDVILCLDILEHLANPWAALGKISALLAPTGTLIASLPNVRNLKVTVPLLLLGRWEYQDEGILDRTHLRFFTRSSMIDLVKSAGLEVTKVEPNFGKYTRILNGISLGLFAQLLATQYLVAARLPDSRR